MRAALGGDPPILNGGESPATLAIGETIFATGDPMRLIVLASAPGVIELAIDPGEVARVVGDVRRNIGDVLRRIGEVVRLTGGAERGFFAAVKEGYTGVGSTSGTLPAWSPKRDAVSALPNRTVGGRELSVDTL